MNATVAEVRHSIDGNKSRVPGETNTKKSSRPIVGGGDWSAFSEYNKLKVDSTGNVDETRTSTLDQQKHLNGVDVEEPQLSPPLLEGDPVANSNGSEALYDRTAKVAKMRYSDHGSHGVILSAENKRPEKRSLLSQIICSLDKTYNEVNKKAEGNVSEKLAGSDGGILYSVTNRSSKKRVSPGNCPLSPHLRTSSQSGTKSGAAVGTVKTFATPKKEHTQDSRSPPPGPRSLRSSQSEKKSAPAGLLHAALQGSGLNINEGERNQSVPPPSNRGTCLTNPSTPESNNGLDNVEGNLIVYTNDIMRVPNQNIHYHRVHKKEPKSNFIHADAFASTNFEVLGLLGQGTFAQVFKCRNIKTGQLVALKIVKNKPAYTRQATIEIDVFQAMAKDKPPAHQDDGIMGQRDANGNVMNSASEGKTNKDNMVTLICYFVHQSHLCLVFELLGLNLYELLKQRQFRGLPIGVVRELVKQAINGVKDLSQRGIVHCDLKPENILVVSDEAKESIVSEGGNERSSAERRNVDIKRSGSTQTNQQQIKLIDFGSACFEGQTAHTYIQSRFYRSPEVLVGLDYDSAIDMWSLGCVAAELFLGLPILPGVHEHDQLSRISEMIGKIPEWMLEQGTKSTKYFVKNIEKYRQNDIHGSSILTGPQNLGTTVNPPPRPVWRLKTREDFIRSLSDEERDRRGGLSKLEQQPTNRYFKRKLLGDIVMLHGNCNTNEEIESLSLFVHFLKGILDPDPWKRWTAHQASMHPFITGITSHVRRTNTEDNTNSGMHKTMGKEVESNGNLQKYPDIYWVPPWDPSICRRKLLCVQKAREEQASRRGSRVTGGTVLSRSFLPETSETPAETFDEYPPENLASPEYASTSRVTANIDAMSISSLQSQGMLLSRSEQQYNNDNESSPPSTLSLLDVSAGRPPPQAGSNLQFSHQHGLSGSLGTAIGASQYHAAQKMLGSSHYRPHASSLAHYHQQAGAVMDSPDSMMPPQTLHDDRIERDYLYGIQPMLPALAPQSYSGVYYDRIHHLPAEGDLGYALQRPGVVPEGGDPALQGNTLAYLQQHPPSHPQNLTLVGRSVSLTSGGGNSGVNVGRRRVGSFQSLGTNSISNLTSSATSQSLKRNAQFVLPQEQISMKPLHSGLMPTNVGQHSNLNAVNIPGESSLLAQKLAEHSAHNILQGGSDLQARTEFKGPGSYQNQSVLPDNTVAGSMGSLQAAQFINFVSANGNPMFMSSSANGLDPHLSGSYTHGRMNYFQTNGSNYGSLQDAMALQPQAQHYLRSSYLQQSSYPLNDYQQEGVQNLQETYLQQPSDRQQRSYRGSSM